MPEGRAPLDLHAADLQLIAEGGTRRVYRHPRYPGLVFKRFRDEPSDHYLKSLVGNVEFAEYLAERVEVLDVLMHEGGIARREILLSQPFTDIVRRGISVNLSYWELRGDLPAAACAANAAEHVVAIMDEAEPAASEIRRLVARSAPFAISLERLYARIAAYVRRTGMIIDFVGAHNVVAFCDADWDVEILDAVKGDPIGLSDRSIGGGPRSDLHDAAAALNVCAFFRMIFFLENVLATDALSTQFSGPWIAAIGELQSNRHDPVIRSLREAHGMPMLDKSQASAPWSRVDAPSSSRASANTRA